MYNAMALAQGSNKAERLPALDTACQGGVEGASVHLANI